MNLVSVIIPTYNRSSIISQTIDNVLQQTYPNLEIIVVDDGSTDDTIAKLQPYLNRIKILSQENAGPASARNHGVRASNGDIIAFQDSDDTWHPTKIERQVRLLGIAGNAVPCCLCNSLVHMEHGRSMLSFDRMSAETYLEEGIWLNPFDVLATRFILFNQAAAVRRKAFEDVGGFDESFRIMEDVDLQLRLSLKGRWAFIREPLAIREERFSTSLSHEKDWASLYQNEIRIFEKILGTMSSDQSALAMRLMERGLRRARRRLRATKIQSTRFPAASCFAKGLLFFERGRDAVYRRLPSFPRMRVAAAVYGQESTS
jgi:glycosyltransferase involved in cell wall biosynthesis